MISLIEKFKGYPKLLADIQFLKAKVYCMFLLGFDYRLSDKRFYKWEELFNTYFYDQCFYATEQRKQLYQDYVQEQGMKLNFKTCIYGLELQQWWENEKELKPLPAHSRFWTYAFKITEADVLKRKLKCSMCGADATAMCSGCECEFYCSEECQRAGWESTHKEICKARQEK